MNRLLLLKTWTVGLLISAFSLQLTAQSSDYVKQIGGVSANAYGKSIALDNSGNVYAVGTYSGTVDFNPNPGIMLNYSATGSTDVFITKTNTNGDLIWAKSIGGTAGDEGHAIAIDNSGNIYITGAFFGMVDFNPDPIAEFKLITTSSRDVFVAKYSSEGSFIWAKQLGGTGDERGYGIAVDVSGSVYTTGYFSGTADFDPGTATHTLTSAGGYEVFISKLNTNGEFVWAKQLNGSLSNIGYGIICDTTGNVLLTGYFAGTVDFDPGTTVNQMVSSGDTDIFILKLSSAGSFIWAKQLGGVNQDYGMAITTDNNGNIYTTGFFQTIADFDPHSATTYNISTKGNRDIYISKLTADGEFAWVKQIGGTGDDRGTALHVDNGGNVYAAGYFASTADFNIESCPLEYASYGLIDAFVVKLNNLGELAWVKQIGGSGNDYVYGLTSDLNGELYSTGGFATTAGFNAVDAPIYLTAKGESDAFIYKVFDEQEVNQTTEETLPVVLKYFTGKSLIRSNQLEWATLAEINNNFFEIERSADGENYVVLRQVAAKGNTKKENIYLYQDDLPLKGNNYYRLKQSDTNGRFTYSGTVVLYTGLNDSRSIAVYPNPNKGKVTVSSNDIFEKASLSVFDMHGRLVFKKQNINGDQYQIDLLRHPDGQYILEIHNKGIISKIKLIKN